MQIEITCKGVMSEQVCKQVTDLSALSPTGGWSENKIKAEAESWVKERAEAKFGDHDWWEMVSFEVVN